MALSNLHSSSKQHRGSRAWGAMVEIRSAPVVVIVRSDMENGNAEICNRSLTARSFMCALMMGGDFHKKAKAGIVVFKT